MKRAFTLIEVLLSVSLISFVMIYMYKNITLMKQSNSFFETFYEDKSIDLLIHKTLFLDISQSTEATIGEDKDQNSILTLRTKHSHFGIERPFVLYMLKNENLIRTESIKTLTSPLSSEELEFVKFEVAKKGVKVFKAFQSEQKDDFLLRIDTITFQIQR